MKLCCGLCGRRDTRMGPPDDDDNVPYECELCGAAFVANTASLATALPKYEAMRKARAAVTAMQQVASSG